MGAGVASGLNVAPQSLGRAGEDRGLHTDLRASQAVPEGEAAGGSSWLLAVGGELCALPTAPRCRGVRSKEVS